MASALPISPPTSSSSSPSSSSLFAAIDMGTNSFKMLIVRAYPNGKFFTIDHRREPVVLGRDASSSSSATPFAISADSELRALEALRSFQRVLKSYNISLAQTRCVATSAVREALNKAEFSDTVWDKIGLKVDVLPGEEEARLVYLGMLHFFPIYDKMALCVDIGGGSTEFVVGVKGHVVFATSLNLGHVTLTQKFGEDTDQGVRLMREYIRSVIQNSGLVETIKRCGFEVAVGSSGTIQALEKAVFHRYANGGSVLDDVGLVCGGEVKRDWRLNRGELRDVVERLYGVGDEEESVRRDKFFKRRSEFIVAGAILLEEIFETLGIEEMEVSGFALAEGVIAEILTKVYDGYDLNANARWGSVVQLATRFNSKKRMIAAAQCAGLAKEIFEELKKCSELAADSLDEKDLEYLEAACMLHNIGLFAGKKGFHNRSYRIIMNGDHLHGYSTEEIKLIALLVRHHRKKLPKLDRASFKEFPEEVQKKFTFLCAIIRISVALWQQQCLNIQEAESSHSYDKLVFRGLKDQNLLSTTILSLTESENNGEDLRQELEHFKMFLQGQQNDERHMGYFMERGLVLTDVLLKFMDQREPRSV